MQSSDCERFTNLNFVTMNAKVKEFLEKKQAEESAVLLEKKHRLLRVLGLVEKVEVEKDNEDFIEHYYDSDKGVYYKYGYPEITDEEYKELQKHDPTREVEPESNGEKGLLAIAGICLCLCIIAFLVCIFVAMEDGEFNMLIYGASVLVLGLVQLWIVKVFTNISRKTTAIYQLLKDKEK